MSILLTRAFSRAASLVLVAILLLVAIVALIYAFDQKSVPTAWVSNLAQVTAETQDRVLFGPTTPFTCFDANASISSGTAENGGNSISIATTKWTGGILRFIDACGGAINFGGYDRIEIHIKATTATPDPLVTYLHSYTAAADSQPVTSNPTGSWSTITISMASLKGSGTWDLSSTQELRFKETTNSTTYYIDSIVLKASGANPNPIPVPVVTFSASPTSITAGQNVTLTWSSTNSPTSCTASGGWSGTKAASGSQIVTPTTNTTYGLACSNASGISASVGAAVVVTGTGTPLPYQKIKVRGWTAPVTNVSPGSTLSFDLNWVGGANYSATSPIPAPLKGTTWMAFVHFQNMTTGAYLKGADFYPSPSATNWPSTGVVSTAVSYKVPVNAPSGTYAVMVGLYSGEQRLELQADTSAGATDAGAYRYRVGTFTIGGSAQVPTPVINSISLPYCIRGVYFCRQDIQGINFALTGNNLKLTSTTTGAVTSLGINGVNIGNLDSSGTQLVADVPGTIVEGKYLLTDTVSVGGVTKISNAVPFEILSIDNVTKITGVTPSTGPLGQMVTISGTHFTQNNTVQIGPFSFYNISPNAAGNLIVSIPTSTTYTAYIGTPLKVYVENDDYGYSGDNPNATQYTFTIQSGNQTDTTKPVITGIASTTTTTTATITWNTNELADTQVLYGTTNGYGSNTTLDSTKVTGHTATISGLTANAIYHFSVNSKDAAGNLATSSDMTFRTKTLGGDSQPPFAPYAVTATAVSSSAINLTWGAAVDDVGVAGYRVIRDGVVASTTSALAFTDSGLTPATTYSYVIKAFDAANNVSASSSPAVSATTQTTSTGVTATLTSSKTGVMYGEKALITRSSTNASSCTLTDGIDDNSDGWSGATTTSGTLTVSPSISTGYSMTCTGPLGTSPKATIVIRHVDANPNTDITFLGLSAVVQKSPAQITLSWYPDPWAQASANYTIYRSTVIGGPAGGAGTWTQIGSGTGITSYTDTSVTAGTAYEYRVNRANTQHNADAYIYTGIELPQVTTRGKIILMVDSRFATSLATKIDRLKDDLVGDGWVVLDHSVPSTATADSVKSTIKADYTADPTNTKAVFLLGHIPVFKSGNLNPDGHGSRSMPADGFYGDMDGTWTTSTTYIPSDIELEVGRVDMYNMPAFTPLTETDLLSRYLDKDHDFRTKVFNSAIYNNPKAAMMTSDTNRSFQRQFFGSALPLNIESIQFEALYSPEFWNNVEGNNNYLWFSRGSGGGQLTGATGIGYTSDFASSAGYNVVFNSMFASYFEEWDVQNNFLRAPLAAKGYALTNAWSDNPVWVFAHMGLGKEIGFSAKTSQNNNTYYNLPGYAGLPESHRGVHMNLMGDPTLRMQVVAPVTNVARADSTGSTVITWNASPDAGRGYNVYESTNGKAGPFTLITATPVTGTTYTDSSGGAQYTYMVRAVKLEVTPSGSYVNQSQGVFAVGGGAPVNPPPAGDIDVTGGIKIWDGDTIAGVISGGGLVNGGVVGKAAQSNGTDNWLNLPISSLSIPSQYDKFVFYIKSDSPTGITDVTFFLSTNAGSSDPATKSATISLPGPTATPYVQGGSVNNAWHQVVINTSDLVRPGATNLTFRFNDKTVVAVDEFYLVNTQGNAPAYEPISSRVIRLSMGEAYDRASAVTTSNYILKDTVANTVVPIVGVGRESLLTGFIGPLLLPPADAPITSNNLYLVFGADMAAGKQYTLTINNIKTADGVDYPRPEVITFTYDDNKVTNSVKANQVGFVPSAHKYVYIGNYLGDYQEFGNMPIPATPVCKLFSASVTNPQSATPLATVTATDEGNDIRIGQHVIGYDTNSNPIYAPHRYSMSGERVYSCDFASYQTPGNYYVYAPGYGKTYPFTIGSSVYNDVFKIAAKGLYFQRDDIALTSPYADGIAWGLGKSWARAAGSGLDATSFVHSSVLLNPFGKAADVHAVVDTRKGWYDAADYGKYVESGSGALYELLTAYELQPTKYVDSQLTIPESGNGAPDILDEAKWELDWMLSMQNMTDGFVYHRVATSQWGNLVPWNDNSPRWLSEKSTSATLRFAAIMAKASVDMKPYFPTAAATYLARARMAYAAGYPGIGTSVRAGFNGPASGCVDYDAAKNPNPGRPCLIKGNGSMVTFNGSSVPETSTGGGENADSGNSDDERLWAAAELFRATGESAFHTDFKDMAGRVALQTTWNSYGSDSEGRAGFTYARTAGADQTIVNKYLYVGNNSAYTVTNPGPATLLAFANETVANIRNNTYHNGSYTDTPGTGWGAFSESTRWAWALIKASELVKGINPTLAATYLDNAKIALDVQLGGNPLNKTFITGVGSNPPMRPLHTISSTDGKNDPVPGIPIYGIQSELTDGAPHRKVNELTYPSLVSKWDVFPIWRRYVDSSAIVDMGEFTIIDMGYTAAVYGYFSN